MMYNYRSPLLDEEFQRLHEQHERGYMPPPGRHERGFMPRPMRHERGFMPPPGQHQRGFMPPPGRHERGFMPPPRPFPLRVSPPFIRPSRPMCSPYPRPSETSTYSSRYQLSSCPKELNDMFGALECRLCSVEVSSPIAAKMHYSGKPHMKKVKMFLTKWSLKTGNPMPQFEQQVSKTSISSMPDYCELCNVTLVSVNDKMLHYTGRTHKKNELDPANAKKKGKMYNIDDSSADIRFGIGTDFSPDAKLLLGSNSAQGHNFSCELCGVKAVSQEQLKVHLGGKKHQEKLKKKEAGIPKPERPYKCDVCNISVDTEYLLRIHLEGKPHQKTLKRAIAEFKGGRCKDCDVFYTSYVNYQDHIRGKKHEKKCRQNAERTPEAIKDQKEFIACRKCPFVGNLDKHKCDESLENIKTKSESDSKWICNPCYGATFETEEEYEKHKETRRHLLCMLNIEGDKLQPDKIYFYCFTCRKQYNDQKEYTEHLFSHRHMTLSDTKCDLNNRKDLWHCEVCSIVIDQEAKQDHNNSKHHLTLMVQQELTSLLTQLATQDVRTSVFKCSHCDVSFVNFAAYTDHMLNPAHVEDIVCKTFMKV